MKLSALIFDVDGTLAETEELHRQTFNAAFAQAGLPWYWDEALYSRLLEITGGKERIRHYIASCGGRPILDQGAIASLHADKTALYAACVKSGAITLRPGVNRLLDEARSSGLTIAIATTTSPANVRALVETTLGSNGLSRFSVIAAGDCVPAKKPAPDVYRFVLERLGLAPDACIALEDTPNGLRAALAAGIPTLVTTSCYGGLNGFSRALAVVDHLGDPGKPCTVLQGPGLEARMVDLAWLRDVARPAPLDRNEQARRTSQSPASPPCSRS